MSIKNFPLLNLTSTVSGDFNERTSPTSSIAKKYLNYPCISVSGSKDVCKNLKKIWKKKY